MRPSRLNARLCLSQPRSLLDDISGFSDKFKLSLVIKAPEREIEVQTLRRHWFALLTLLAVFLQTPIFNRWQSGWEDTLMRFHPSNYLALNLSMVLPVIVLPAQKHLNGYDSLY